MSDAGYERASAAAGYTDSARVLLLRGDGSVLLVRSTGEDAFYPDMWLVPGGRVERGETVAEAAAREAEEELGVALDGRDLVRVAALAGANGLLHHYLVARRWEGEPVNREPRLVRSLAFWPVDDLPDTMIWRDVAGVRAAGVEGGVRS